MCTYKLNNAKNGIELYFSTVPALAIRESLKNAGWRWSRFGGCWYNKQSEEALQFAQSLADGKTPTEQPKNAPFEINEANLRACINFEKWRSREWSDVATISRAIKKFMNKAGIPCEVRSSRFSGGDSVAVETTDLKYETEKKLAELLEPFFSGGHFDGMNDIYEYARGKDDRPTTKYFFYRNLLSDELKKEIEDYLKNTISGIDFNDWQEKAHWINKAHEGDLCGECPVFGK